MHFYQKTWQFLCTRCSSKVVEPPNLFSSSQIMRYLKFTLAIMAGLASTLSLQALTVTQLRCEDLTNPQGIDVTEPRLSWILSSDANDQRQTAYQILVASTAK